MFARDVLLNEGKCTPRQVIRVYGCRFEQAVHALNILADEFTWLVHKPRCKRKLDTEWIIKDAKLIEAVVSAAKPKRSSKLD
jgi:hypothetical protein